MPRVVSCILRAFVLVGTLTHVSFADDKEPTQVGMVIPLSGPLAEMGASFRRGVELYRADHPEAQVSFVFEDHKYDGKSAVTALHALRAQKDVELVVVWGNAPSSAAAPVAEQQKLPMLAVSMNPDARGRKFVVSLGSPIERVANTVVEKLRSSGTLHPGAVVIDIGNALEAIELIDRGLGGGALKKIVANEEVDFKPILSQFKSRSIDGIVLFLLPQQALTFLKQAKQMEYFPHIIGGDVFAVESFQKEALEFTQKASLVYGAVNPDFRERLSKIPDGSSYFFEAATGYSVAAISGALVERWKGGASSGDPLEVSSSLDLKGLPISSLEFKEDSSFGRHFEAGVSIYPLAPHTENSDINNTPIVR